MSNLYKYIRATWITAYILSILISNIVSQKMYSQPKLDSHILLLTTSNTTDIYRDNNIYIILNPPLNTTIILKINKINEYHNLVIVKPIEIENGYREYTIRFNETGTYTLNISWNGNNHYKPTWNIQTIQVVSNINASILDTNLNISNTIVEIYNSIKINIDANQTLCLEIYSPIKTYLYKIDREITFIPNITGIWAICLKKDNLRSKPKIFYVKKRTEIILEASQKIIAVGEEVKIIAEIEDGNCIGKIDLYIWNNNKWIYYSTEKIYQNKSIFHWKPLKEGKYMFKAKWNGDITHLKSESNILKITATSKKHITTIETLDSMGRKLIGTKIIIQNKTYPTIDGKINLLLKSDIYNIIIIWKNTIVYQGKINITRGKTYKINCNVYNLTIRLRNWPIPTPIIGQPITIQGNRIKTTQITDRNGEIIIKLPIGNYTIKTNTSQEKINLNKNTTIEIKQQSWNQITILALLIAIIALLIFLSKAKIEIIITK